MTTKKVAVGAGTNFEFDFNKIMFMQLVTLIAWYNGINMTWWIAWLPSIAYGLYAGLAVIILVLAAIGIELNEGKQ